MPADLKRFKSLTSGHTVVMGRRTFESLPNGALPNRRNIVLSRTVRTYEGAETYTSLEEALHHCGEEETVFVIGGAQIYREALPHADILNLTVIEDDTAKADTFFPHIDFQEWELLGEEKHPADEKHAHAYRFADYRRRR